ncbi:MAG: EamA family transporter RarD [Pseudomonadota bacterium]
MTDSLKGFFALVAASVIWGLSPIYYKALAHVPPIEVLSHRTLWSLVFFGSVLAFQARLFDVGRAFKGRNAALKLMLSAMLISFNWGVFIWSIQVGRTVEASLGYYIFPLISVVVGMIVFREGWQAGKLIAFGLACAAVIVLTVGLGAAPWVSIALALSFAAYGVIKKTSETGPTVGVTAEVVLLAPFALAWLAWLHLGLGQTGASDVAGGAFGTSMRDTLLLIFAGPITAAPLILFSYASRRLRFATLGLVLYLNPTLQFLVAVFIFTEPLTLWHGIALPLIWLGLAVYTVSLYASERASRRSDISSSTL